MRRSNGAGPRKSLVEFRIPEEPSAAAREAAKIAVLSRSTGAFSYVRRLTIAEAEAYIAPLGRVAAGCGVSSAKPLTVHTVTEQSAI